MDLLMHGRWKSQRSASLLLEKRVDHLRELAYRRVADEPLAVDEEGRRRIHAEHLAGMLAIRLELVEKGLIAQALVVALLGEADLLGDDEQPAFVEAFRQRLLSAYPPRADGSTLFPFTRLFIVATR